MLLQYAGERRAGVLPLVGVEDLRASVAAQGALQGADTEVFGCGSSTTTANPSETVA
jgi:hypothetical protein